MYQLAASMYLLLPSLHEIWESILSVIRTMKVVDFIDIAVLSYIIYYFFKLIRETRAGQLTKGIFFLALAYVVAQMAGMKAIPYLLESLFRIGLLAILIVFQPEVRRAVENLGHSRLGLSSLGLFGASDEVEAKWRVAVDAICDACVELSETCTGALIVIEQQTRLGEQIETGVIVNAAPSKQLFGNIFFKNTPLHDGAVIMRDGMVLAAACFLPKPQKEELINKKLGSRHRAAIGMSENSDAIVIVVSEESGAISVAENGRLTRNYTRERLHNFLLERLVDQPKRSLRDLLNGKPVGEDVTVDEAVQAQMAPEEAEAVWREAINVICTSCENLGKVHAGALIAIEQQTRLDKQIGSGSVLRADPSWLLFESIFGTNAPLREGAVVMRSGEVYAAACTLPLYRGDAPEGKTYSSRQRAALGMSSESDAIVIAVSEESGAIFVAENGRLTAGYTKDKLRKLLFDRLVFHRRPEPQEEKPVQKPSVKKKPVESAGKEEQHEEGKAS